jgi:hypothetical protein
MFFSGNKCVAKEKKDLKRKIRKIQQHHLALLFSREISDNFAE